jgi:hypothetical protein
MMVLQTGLAALLLALPAFLVTPAPDPGPPQDHVKPSPQGIEAGLKMRREYLQKLEEYTQTLRDEVKLELADVVAGQHVATLRAEKEYQDARLAREVAEYQVKEYTEGIFFQDHAIAEGKVKLAAADLERVRDRLAVFDQKRGQGVAVNPIEGTRAQLQLQEAEFESEAAETELSILTNDTKEKETKKREAAVASAEALEAEKKNALDRERAKEKKLEEQAERFKVRSPEDHVLALLDDAIRSEAKVVDLIADARKIEAQVRDKPDEAAKLAEQLRARKDEANGLMDRAKAELLEAANLGERVRSLRAGLRDAEARLKNERELLDRLEREFSAKK